MLIKIILVIVIIALLFQGYQFTQKSGKAKSKQSQIITIAILLAIGTLLVLVATGRMHWFGAVIAAILPFLRVVAIALARFIPLWFRNTGGVVNFRTEYIDARIEISKMRVSGKIIQGEFAGKRLESLDDEQFNQLLAHCKTHDSRAYYLLKIARKNISAEPQGTVATTAAPSIQQSLDILGLAPTATREEILAAHRRLIQKLHPDRGGSDFLAAQVNLARDILLQERERRETGAD